MIKYLMCTFFILNCLLAFGQICRDSIVAGTSALPRNFERDDSRINYQKENNHIWRSYYENGQIHSEGKFKKKLGMIKFRFFYYNIKHGTFKYYSKEGELKKIEYYKKDKLFKEEILDSAYFNIDVPNELVK